MIYVYPAGYDACAHNRLIWPGQVLQAAGEAVHVVMPEDRRFDKYQINAQVRTDPDGTETVIGVIVPDDAEAIVLQRVTHRKLAAAVPMIREKGIAVIVDMDDDLEHVHPANPAHNWLHPKAKTDHNWDNARNAARNATWVTTTSPALLRIYASSPARSTVIPNMTRRRDLELFHGRVDNGCFGWTGNLKSHPDDPQVMGSTVQRLVREGFPFHMVGNPIGVAAEMRLDPATLSCSGITDQEGWMPEVRRLHVGVAPLANTLFNQSKSWLKPMEMAAVGVPCVMSDRAEYRKINARGVGVLAKSPKDFYREVRRLMTDDAWHAEVQERSREAVREAMMLEDNAGRWLEAWQAAIEIEHSLALAGV